MTLTSAIYWRGNPCQIIRDDGAWLLIMILCAIPYCVFARESELKRD